MRIASVHHSKTTSQPQHPSFLCLDANDQTPTLTTHGNADQVSFFQQRLVRTLSPLFHADANAQTPTLMTHGDADQVITLERAQRSVAGLTKPNFEFRVYPGLGESQKA